MWGGISIQRATRLVMFTGIMNAVRYGKILESSLVPFIKTYFPDDYRLQQDNDPKHTSKYIGCLFKFQNIYWWKTPAESPDLNPIENCWGSLQQYLRNSFKPTNLQELLMVSSNFGCHSPQRFIPNTYNTCTKSCLK